MKRPVSSALLFAALLAVATGPAAAQQANNFIFKDDPGRTSDDRALRPIRVDPMRLREDAFGQSYDLFGIPLTGERTSAREKGFSFGVRPAKGVRAVARIRF